MKQRAFVFLFFFIIVLLSCQEDDPNNTITIKPAVVFFHNSSGYRVDIYKNLNPEHFDPTTLVCTVSPADTHRVELYPSFDQVIGDSFYIRYKIQLPYVAGQDTTPVYVDAERVLTNLTFVIKNDETYTKTIPHPNSGELRFFNGYILVNNFANVQVQIIRGSSILPRLDNGTVFINTGSRSYYEIEFSFFDNTLSIDQLNAFTNNNTPFPPFTMERGKYYEFTVWGDRVTPADPLGRSILPE